MFCAQCLAKKKRAHWETSTCKLQCRILNARFNNMHANLADAIKQCAMHIAYTIAIGIDKGYDTAVYKCLFPNVHVSSLPGIAHKTFETRPTPAISSFW